MKQLVSLTLRILMSLYPRANLDIAGEGFTATCTDEEVSKPRANLDIAGEGFAATCTDEEVSKLVEDSTVMADRIIEML
jgi:hypothetical protein